MILALSCAVHGTFPYFPGPETKADGALTSYSSPQPTRVTSDLAPHFKFVHDCPGTGSKEELIEN